MFNSYVKITEGNTYGYIQYVHVCLLYHTYSIYIEHTYSIHQFSYVT